MMSPQRNPNNGESSTKQQNYMATSARHPRSRPAFEKLLIGPLMIFGEHITGGHYLEVLRLSKQISVGQGFGPSYWQLHKQLVAESGFAGAFFRGFFPWGLFQCLKGVPVLFVQHESMHRLRRNEYCSPYMAEKASGFFGGTAQALFVCPLQKIKVAVVASQEINSMSATEACLNVVRHQGLTSLLDGLMPMMLQKSVDYGIRFGASSEIKNLVLAQKEAKGELPQLSAMELIGCGFVGGACSSLTSPIDNIITNCQKPMPMGVRRDVFAVSIRMLSEGGVRSFFKGWSIKVFDNAYHMAWMYGVGTILYEYMQKALYQQHSPMYAV